MKFTDEQEQLIESRETLQICNAVAGSGKTATLCEKIRRRIAEGMKPQEILCLTFTNTAAKQIKERTHKKVKACTLHSWAMSQLGFSASDLMSEEEERALVAKCEKLLGQKVEKRKFAEAMASPYDVPGYIGVFQREFRAQMRATGRYSFDAILLFFLEYLDSKACSYSMLIVDEAQDSSAIDFAIYSKIEAREKIFVGDENQAIFGFRGTSNRFFARLKKEGRTYSLTRSFRCSLQICKVASELSRVDMKGTADQGQAQALIFENAAEQLEAVMDFVEFQKQDDESEKPTAILCRYNDQVDEVCRFLATHDVYFYRGLPSEQPIDRFEAIRAAQKSAKPYRQPVCVSTIHNAKGREFEAVAIPFCNRLGPRADFGEELRVFYVAVTRARDKVLATYSRKIVERGFARPVEPSPFLEAFESVEIA